MGKTLQLIDTESGFLNRTQVVQLLKPSTDKYKCQETKSFCTKKGHHSSSEETTCRMKKEFFLAVYIHICISDR